MFKAILHLGLLTSARRACPVWSGGFQQLWFYLNPPLSSLCFSSLSSWNILGSVLFWGLSYSFLWLEDSRRSSPPSLLHCLVSIYLSFRSYLRPAWTLQISQAPRGCAFGWAECALNNGSWSRREREEVLCKSCALGLGCIHLQKEIPSRELEKRSSHLPNCAPLCASIRRGCLLTCPLRGDGFF